MPETPHLGGVPLRWLQMCQKKKEKKGFGSRGIKPPGLPPWTLPGPQTTSPPQPDLLSDRAKEPQLSGLFLWPGSSTDPGEGNSLFFSSSSFVVRAVSPKQENGTGVNPQTSRVRKVRAPLTPQGLHQELSDAPAQIWDVRLVFNHMGAKRNYWASFWVVAIYLNFSQIDWPVASLFHFDFQVFFFKSSPLQVDNLCFHQTAWITHCPVLLSVHTQHDFFSFSEQCSLDREHKQLHFNICCCELSRMTSATHSC